jgi:hypothetical protein
MNFNLLLTHFPMELSNFALSLLTDGYQWCDCIPVSLDGRLILCLMFEC